MTNEQWLIYLYGIYPEGGYQAFYVIAFILSTIIMLFFRADYCDTAKSTYNPTTNERFTTETKQEFLKQTNFVKLGKLIYIVPSTFLFLAILCNFVPSKNAFVYIIAAPYVVDSTKSLVESLQDPTSKAYKINQILDKSLDKAITELEKSNNGK